MENLGFDQLALEQDNIREALRWSIEANPTVALALAGSLQEFWRKRGYFTEGRAWLAQALSHNPAMPTLARGKALRGAGILAMIQGDYGQATGYLEESLALYRQLGEQQGIARVLNSLGLVALYQNDPARAKPFLEQGLSLQRTIGDLSGMAKSLNNLGLVAICLDDFDRSRALFEEKLALARASNDENGIEITLMNMGYCELLSGAPDAARTCFTASMSMALHSHDRETMAYRLEGLAEILGLYAATYEARQIAATLLGAADALRQLLGAPLPLMDRKLYEHTLRQIRSVLDDAAFSVAWARGQAMNLDEAVALALQTA